MQESGYYRNEGVQGRKGTSGHVLSLDWFSLFDVSIACAFLNDDDLILST